MSCLHKASRLFEQCDMHELSIEVEERLVRFHKAKGDLDSIVECHKRLLTLYQATASFNTQGDVRVFGTYYRVGFYGKAFGETLNGIEYVYKEPSLTQLSEINQRLVGFFSKILNTNVTVFKDSNIVDMSKLDANDCKLQITALDSFVPDPDKRKFHFDQLNRINSFSFDTPFTISGKAHGSTHEQWKRKTVLTVANNFPYIVKRQQVIARSEIILSPIETVIEDIIKRIDRFNSEMSPISGPPSLKTLNQVLSGSVNMQVHGGIEEVTQSFLHVDKVGSFEEHHIVRLRHYIGLFLDACSRALTVARKLCTEMDNQFQAVLENGFKTLVARCIEIDPKLSKVV